MDLACDPSSLIGHRPAELGIGDRAPDSDQEHPVCDEAQEVTLEEEVARHDRSQRKVEIGEQG